MSVLILNPDEIAELKGLRAAHDAAINEIVVVGQTLGPGSQEFANADKKIGAINAKIRKILGLTGSHWMA